MQDDVGQPDNNHLARRFLFTPQDIGRFKAKNEALIATIKELEGQQATPKKQRPA
jgi:hypothetical protein